MSRSRWRRLPLVPSALAFGALMVLGCVPGAERHQASTPPRWTSRAIPEARGEVKAVDGKRVQVRYKDDAFSAITANFEQWPTYAYDDTRKFPPPNRISMPVVKGDPRRGRELFRARDKAPCTGCHLIPGDDIWPAGSVGPDLSVIGDRRLPDQYLFDFVWDARLFLPNPTMPPWGTSGILSPEETVHIVAFLPVGREILRVSGGHALHGFLQAALVAIGARLARWSFRRPHRQAALRQEDRRVVGRVEVVAPVETWRPTHPSTPTSSSTSPRSTTASR